MEFDDVVWYSFMWHYLIDYCVPAQGSSLFFNYSSSFCIFFLNLNQSPKEVCLLDIVD